MKIILYQIIPELDSKRLMYNRLEYIMKSCGDKFPAEIYELVFSGDVEAKSFDDVWRIFNTSLPDGYKGRSMSVSDVVEIIDSDNQSKFFFCDSLGFKEIEFDKKNAMTLVLNHNFDCVQEKRENVSVFFIGESGLLQVKCKEFELTRCKYSQTQLGYRLICRRMDGRVLNYDFSERPSIILSECIEEFPEELLYIDGKRKRYTAHDKANLGIVCTWLKGDKIYFPSEYKSCAYNYSKKVIYSLESDSIKIVMNNVDDERIFDYFKEEGIETRYVILDNCIKLSDLAKRTLQLHNNDIVELCIDDEMIAITKES